MAQPQIIERTMIGFMVSKEGPTTWERPPGGSGLDGSPGAIRCAPIPPPDHSFDEAFRFCVSSPSLESSCATPTFGIARDCPCLLAVCLSIGNGLDWHDPMRDPLWKGLSFRTAHHPYGPMYRTDPYYHTDPCGNFPHDAGGPLP